MGDTKIEWTQNSDGTKGKTWNPVTGCTKISPGCQNCYAERMSKRLAGRCGYPKNEPFTVTLHPDHLEEPLHWRKPNRIFVCSMGDLFHEDVPFEFVDSIFAIMTSAVDHTFLLLTKRPDRMLKYMKRVETNGPTARSSYVQQMEDYHKQHIENYTLGWTPPPPPEPEVRFLYDSAIKYEAAAPEWKGIFYNHQHHWRKWPLRNVWLGITAENQEQADKRTPILLQIPAAVRFVSVEPMLSEIDLSRYLKWPVCKIWRPADGGNDHEYGKYQWVKQKLVLQGYVGIDQVFCGGETGPGARPMHPDWVRSLRNQCQAAGVSFFFKQWGDWISHWDIGNIPGTNIQTIVNGLSFYRVGKKASGRLLDGRTWDEIPGVQP
jgi:protein gp37